MSSDKLAGKGAVTVNMSDFPATFISRSKIGQCTASIIGPFTVLLAAHCVKDAGKISIAGRNATCAHSPKYNPRIAYGWTADYALCKLSSAKQNIKYSTIKTDLDKVFVGGFLLLSGAGCTTKNPPTYDKTFRVGYARILALPKGKSNDIVTERDSVHSGSDQGVALCSGDSGGPTFYTPNTKEISVRDVVAVNSRSAMSCIYGPKPGGGCIEDYAAIEGKSFHSSLSTPDARKFIAAWLEQNDAKICGWNLSGDKRR